MSARTGVLTLIQEERDDNGSARAHRIAVLLLPLRRSDSRRSFAPAYRSVRRFELRARATEAFLQFDRSASIDLEVPLRLLLIGYLYGITSERRLLEEVKDALGLSLVHTAGLWGRDSEALDIFQEPAWALSPVRHISRGV